MIKRKPLTAFNLLELVLGLTCLLALITPLAMNVYRGPALWRYFLVLAILPPMWLACKLSCIAVQKQRKHIILLIVGATFFIASLVALTPSKNAVRNLLDITPLESCLTSHNLSTGYGDYWNAKAHIFISEGRIHIIQLNDGKPYPFAFNAHWFRERANRDKPLEPNFIIMQNLNESDVLSLFGKPDGIIGCSKKTIWIYKDGITIN